MNGTLVPGNHAPLFAGSPLDSALDTGNGLLYVSNRGPVIAVVNPMQGRTIDLIAVGGATWGIAFDSHNGYVYAGDTDNGTLAVIDGSLQKVVHWIPVGTGPDGVAFDPRNGYIYAANRGSGNVTVIDGRTNGTVTSITVGAVPWGIAEDPVNGHLFVSNEGSNTVSIIDDTTNKVIGTVPVGSEPSHSAFDSLSGEVFVADQGSQSVSVIDGVNGSLVSTIPAWVNPWGVAFDSFNGFVYVTDENGAGVGNTLGRITVINGSNNSVVTTVAVGVKNFPEGITFDARTRDLYFSSIDDIKVLNASNQIVDGSIKLGADPEGLAYDPVNGDLYVAVRGGNNLTVLNGSTGRVVKSIPVGGDPSGVAYDALNGRLYVTNGSDLTSINTATDSVIGSVTVGGEPSSVTVDYSSGLLYVTDVASNDVAVVNPSTNSIVTAIPVGVRPVAAAYDPANDSIYVVDLGPANQVGGQSDNVTVIKGSTNQVIATVSVGLFPRGIAYDALNRLIYVANSASGNLSVIDPTSNKPVGTVWVQGAPFGLASDALNGRLYVALGSAVAVVNAATNRVVGNVTVGSGPLGLAVDTGNELAYVTNYNSGTVSILRPTVYPPSLYNVTFQESGLPTGTPWFVRLNGVWNSSSGERTGFVVVNGTYPFAISRVPGFLITPQFGNITIRGQNALVQLAFARTYGVTFIASGLIPGTWWVVRVGGLVLNSTNSSQVASLRNGSYSFAVEPAPRFTSTTLKGTVAVAGGGANISIRFVQVLRIVAFDATPSTVVAFASFNLTVVAQGGLPPIAFNFSGLVGSCVWAARTVLTCVFAEPGPHEVDVTATDAMGQDAKALTIVNVTANATSPNPKPRSPPPPSTVLGLPPWEAYLAIGGLVILLLSVMGAVAVILSRRRSVPRVNSVTRHLRTR